MAAEIQGASSLAGGSVGDPGQSLAFLATTEPTRYEKRLAVGVIAISTIVFVALVPFAKVKLWPSAAFIPSYQTALVLTDLVTAIILLGQFTRLRSPAILALAAGYFFNTLIIVLHTLSFPGAFGESGVIGGGSQTTVWLYIAWHAGFPISVAAYALLRDREASKRPPHELAVTVGLFVFLAALAVLVLTTVAHDYLPPILVDNRYTPAAMVFLGGCWALSAVTVVILWRRGIRTVLDLWVVVVMVAWVADIGLSAVFNGGRFDLGFYSGRVFGLLAASFVLAVVLLETTGLHSAALGRASRLREQVDAGLEREKRTEEQLRQSQKMEAIGSLTGGMAHDFNNLLAIIIGNLDLLVSHKKDDLQVRELGSEALDAALRGADLTQRLLAFARRQPLQPRRLDLNAMLSSITKLLTRTIGQNLEFVLDLGPDVWPVVADPAQLDAAIANLATNARDAMPNGGNIIIVTGNRHLDADYAAQNPDVAPGDYAMIEISDTGSGMTPYVVQRIFEPFFTTKDEARGTGLGLSMVYGFIKQSGGHISVYSELGVGTTFRLYLPRDLSGAAAAAQPPVENLAAGQGEVVLAVEDNPSLRRVVARQLHELGYRVLEAENATAALDTLAREPVDLLFTDVVMPGGMNGVDLAAQAVARWPHVRVLLTSGFPEAKVNGNRNGNGMRGGDGGNGVRQAAALLNKPYRKEELALALRDALRGG